MTHDRNLAIDWALKAYIALALAFIFAPIAASFVFSFNVDRFPSLPLGGFFRFASGVRLKLRPAPIFVDVPSFAHASLLAHEFKS